MDAALLRRVDQQRVAMLYGNVVAVSGSAILMAALIVVIVWQPGIHLGNLIGWCTAVLLVQAAAQWLSYSYRRAPNTATEPLVWGWRFSFAAAVAGVVWGSAVFVLVGDDQLKLALVAACLAGRATISVMTHASFPAALHCIAVPIFGLLALRYMKVGGYENQALGVMWIAVLGYVLL